MASTNKRHRSRKRAGSDSSCSPPPSMTTPPETGDISTPRSLRVRERLTSPQRELALRLEASTRRGIPCIPCMEAQSEWTPEIGKPILCLEGEQQDTCAGCAEKGRECEKPYGFIAGHAHKLHSWLYAGPVTNFVVKEEQAIIRGYLAASKVPAQESPSHEPVLKAFRLGMNSVISMVAGHEVVIPSITSFCQGAEGMFSLLTNKDNAAGVSPQMSRCLGAEAAVALVKNGEKHVYAESFCKGAETAVSLIGESVGAERSESLKNFCQGAETMLKVLGGDGKASGS